MGRSWAIFGPLGVLFVSNLARSSRNLATWAQFSQILSPFGPSRRRFSTISKLFLRYNFDAEPSSRANVRPAANTVIYDTKRMSELARGSPKSSKNLPECASETPPAFSSLRHRLWTMKNAPGPPQEASWDSLGPLLGPLGALLGSSWALLVALGALLGFKNFLNFSEL